MNLMEVASLHHIDIITGTDLFSKIIPGIPLNLLITGCLFFVNQSPYFAPDDVIDYDLDVRLLGQIVLDGGNRIEWIRVVLMQGEDLWNQFAGDPF